MASFFHFPILSLFSFISLLLLLLLLHIFLLLPLPFSTVIFPRNKHPSFSFIMWESENESLTPRDYSNGLSSAKHALKTDGFELRGKSWYKFSTEFSYSQFLVSTAYCELFLNTLFVFFCSELGISCFLSPFCCWCV